LSEASCGYDTFRYANYRYLERETCIALGRFGIFVEPTSATVLLALWQLLDDGAGGLPGTTVLIFTGSGLKSTTIIDGWFAN
jgi:threonine synthase